MTEIILLSKNALALSAMSSIVAEVSAGWVEKVRVVSVNSYSALSQLELGGTRHAVVVDLSSLACFERYDTIQKIRHIVPQTRVLALCHEPTYSDMFRFISSQCHLVLSDRVDVSHFRSAVQQLVCSQQESTYPPVMSRHKIGYLLLSSREVEVLKLIMHGFSSLSIAEKLGIDVKTVSAHRQSIFIKLQVTNLAGLHDKITHDNELDCPRSVEKVA
ncbi:MAG: LuxR C-terminal-related transcriptional regulator [Rouxiella aceris]|uniref:helix-turn-helix transcriptional regulator n=1 Tax=Rouxiella aceris TaxID=2703884 RepID=UPI0028466DDD|nr:LuxR C-terminal-related transcriptional regulator [Rouxiella aceris]MDR3433246.1 LuxR C-terminal-related transcriptional regulator [Rouxiella aceris]